MQLNVAREVAALKRMTVKELRAKFAEVFGETTNAANRDWLTKRIAWRMQALVEGDLTERARRRAAELACDADLRVTMPKATPEAERTATLPFEPRGDNRLPVPGTIITRRYKNEDLQVKVLTDGRFEFEGDVFKSLSAVAKKITGSHMNGYLFFRLAQGVTA